MGGAKRDRVGTTDGLEATVTVPDDEAGNVAGLEPAVENEEPATPQPGDIDFEVREVQGKGFGIFVPTQKAPLTVANVTWFADQAAADAGVAELRDRFGWTWTPATYEWSEKEQSVDGPYGPETKTVRVRGEKIADGFWSHSYDLVFDPASLVELGLTGGSR